MAKTKSSKSKTKSRGLALAESSKINVEAERVQKYRSLVDIGVALSGEKDVERILDLILDKTLETTNADAASLYLTESIKIDSIANIQNQKYYQVLRFHQTMNRTHGRVVQNKVLDLDSSSIAGHVALTGQAVRVEDCYKLDINSPYKFNTTLDLDSGYKTVSMLAVPMRNADGRVRGVLQIINKLERGVEKAASFDPSEIISFTDEDQELMEAFASQASVAIENAKLTENIENLFESFIRASVTAIETRDPATSGHSDRVAVLTVEFARATHQATEGPYKSVQFSSEQIRELRYAALLHDFGKIGVREAVLQKRNKLYPHEMETILLRLDSARARQEMLTWRDMAHEISSLSDAHGKVSSESSKDKLKRATTVIDQFAQHLQQIRLSIIRANQPQIVEQDFDIASLMGWINKTSRELEHIILTPEEIIKLSLPKGTLGQEERREIESHVSHTYTFLRQIAWTEDLGNVADIAYAHHEKGDGSGYPRKITAEHIPLQSKMMTVADIFDALTSMDRPYKKAASHERAIEILYLEARSGKLDLDLLKVFVESEVYRATEGMNLRKIA
jgi:HD-GYP domain-containing protein (c-di-GMP phosphodiesterase class II)